MLEDPYAYTPGASLISPTFSCYMRANPFSKEKAEYLRAHKRRLYDLGPRSYMRGEYPELPRHYPGSRAVYQWDQIDQVTNRLYYIPQRWTYHRDHLTLPTSKARRELPAQDIEYAVDATRRGVVSYNESKRRARPPSCPPQSQQNEETKRTQEPPGHQGSAVSRSTSQGTAHTARSTSQGRTHTASGDKSARSSSCKRSDRPKTCLPRAPTPQIGIDQPPVQMKALYFRGPYKRPSTMRPPRSPSPSESLSSASSRGHTPLPRDKQVTQNTSNMDNVETQPATSARSDKPASSESATVTRNVTPVSRSPRRRLRTRWSYIADESSNLTSSILDLLQTVTATDGKLKPLSPRADRMHRRSGSLSSNSQSPSGSPRSPNSHNVYRERSQDESQNSSLGHDDPKKTSNNRPPTQNQPTNRVELRSTAKGFNVKVSPLQNSGNQKQGANAQKSSGAERKPRIIKRPVNRTSQPSVPETLPKESSKAEQHDQKALISSDRDAKKETSGQNLSIEPDDDCKETKSSPGSEIKSNEQPATRRLSQKSASSTKSEKENEQPTTRRLSQKSASSTKSELNNPETNSYHVTHGPEPARPTSSISASTTLSGKERILEPKHQSTPDTSRSPSPASSSSGDSNVEYLPVSGNADVGAEQDVERASLLTEELN